MSYEILLAFIGLIITGGAAIIGIMRWIVSVSGVVKDIQHGAHATEVMILDVRHDVKNARTRIDGLEHLRINDVERIVKLETSFHAVEKGLDRIERQQSDNFDALSQSIREIRVVEKKG